MGARVPVAVVGSRELTYACSTRAAMRIPMTNGDRDAARRLYHQLEAHSAELDVEPDEETVAIIEPAARRTV